MVSHILVLANKLKEDWRRKALYLMIDYDLEHPVMLLK